MAQKLTLQSSWARVISILIFWSCILGITPTFSQQSQVDSLKHLIQKAGQDTVKIKALNAFSKIMMYSKPDTAVILGTQALDIARKINHKKYEGNALGNLGVFHAIKGDYPAALDFLHQSVTIGEKVGDKKGLASSYNAIGIVNKNQGQFDKAIEYYLKGLRINEETGNKQQMAALNNNIGAIHHENGRSSYAAGDVTTAQEKFSTALEYYLNALKLKQEIGQTKDPHYTNMLNNIGAIHENLGSFAFSAGDTAIATDKYMKALEYHLKALKIREAAGDKNGMANSYNNIGNLYTTLYQKNSESGNNLQLKAEGRDHKPEALLDTAYQYQYKAFKIQNDIGDKLGVINSLQGLGNILYKKQRYRKAIHFYQQAASKANSTGARALYYEAALKLANCYEKLGDYQTALKHHRVFAKMRDSVHSQESQEKVAKLENKFIAAKRKRKIEVLEKEKEKQAAIAREKERQQLIVVSSVSGGLFLVAIFAFVLFNRLRITRKQKAIIEEQKLMVEEKQKEVMDSITYAKRIQDALLKSEHHESAHLPEHFIYFKPKDIVSGDFYWSLEKDGHLYIAAADCTGHGVPGAFLTMLGTSFLNEINAHDQVLTPAEILNQLRDRFVRELSQTGEADATKDGVDISLIRLKLQTNELQWAGANNPLYRIQDGEIQEIKADKQPIGYTENRKPFTNHTIDLQKGDVIYIFSDGFPDQFGGPKGKKFKYKPFKQLLLSIQNRPMEEQKKILGQRFEEWRGDLEQVDDVCIIGVRI